MRTITDVRHSSLFVCHNGGNMIDLISKHLDFVDGVVFDFGGVIVKAPLGEWKVLPICERIGLPKDKALKSIWKYRDAYDGGFMTGREVYAKILEENGLSADDSFFDEVVKADSEGWTNLAPDTLNIMRELKSMGKKLGILSNMSNEFFDNCYSVIASDYRALCDSEIISSHYHELKPDRPIYDRSARDMGIEPGRLLFLDDNEVNVVAARSYGWRSEVFRA